MWILHISQSLLQILASSFWYFFFDMAKVNPYESPVTYSLGLSTEEKRCERQGKDGVNDSSPPWVPVWAAWGHPRLLVGRAWCSSPGSWPSGGAGWCWMVLCLRPGLVSHDTVCSTYFVTWECALCSLLMHLLVPQTSLPIKHRSQIPQGAWLPVLEDVCM